MGADGGNREGEGMKEEEQGSSACSAGAFPDLFSSESIGVLHVPLPDRSGW